MSSPHPEPISVQRLVDHDEQLLGRFPALAAPIYAAVTSDEPFEQPRNELLKVMAEAAHLHADFDEARKNSGEDGPDGWTVLTQAIAAQHRSLAARVGELAEATTGLDAVAISRTLYGILNLTLDLERRVIPHH